MRTLHIAPGESAGGSLVQAIRDAGQDNEVLPFRDDLSCGPIDQDEPSGRAAWWDLFYDAPYVEAALGEFWKRVATTDVGSSSGLVATPPASLPSFWLGSIDLESGPIKSSTSPEDRRHTGGETVPLRFGRQHAYLSYSPTRFAHFSAAIGRLSPKGARK